MVVCGLAAVLGIALLAGFARDVRTQIDLLASANADSGHWSVAQADVEFLALIVALHEARDDPAALPEVRRRFDVFYGRIGLLQAGDIYRDLARDGEVRDGLDRIDAMLDAAIPVIDGDDATLRAQVPALLAEVAALRPRLRAITLQGQRALAAESDQRRQEAGATLMRIALLAAGMGTVLLVMVVALTLLVRQARRRAGDLAHTHARLQAIITTSLDAVLVVDHQGRILDYNGAAEALFGHPVATALGRDASDLVACAAGDATRTGFPRPGAGLTRVEGIRRDGSRFPAECSVDRTISAEGEVDVCFLRDISARLAAETALVQARDRALAGEEAKAEMLAVMSHEMRTPLNGLLGTAELLGDTRLTARQRRFVDTIRSSGQLLARHVNDVLDISRLDAGMMRVTEAPFDADALLAEVAASQRPLAEAQGNQLRVVRVGGGVGPVLGDARRLRQILLNLTGNAVKFTRDGTITLTAERLDRAMVAFEVLDTGIGIAAADVPRIFDDFVTLDTSYTRAAEGTGLGLPIARRMAGVLRGRIDVQSTPGLGSRFRLVLPLPATDLGVPAAAPARNTPAARAPLRVLVVEDNPVNRMVLREMLLGDGHAVTEAADGAEGVAQAQAAAHDLILMDISMPGMDGVEATRSIREGTGPCRDVPIIALTAHALPSDLERFSRAGVNATLTKPLTRNGLRAILAGHALPPAVDTAQARDLAMGLRPEVMTSLLTRFAAETSDGLEELRAKSAQDGTDEDLGRIAHRLAGSAALFGASRLRSALIALETAVKTGDTPRIPSLIAAAEAAWLVTQPAFARHFGIEPATAAPGSIDGVTSDDVAG